jgi:hypothetical protein
MLPAPPRPVDALEDAEEEDEVEEVWEESRVRCGEMDVMEGRARGLVGLLDEDEDELETLNLLPAPPRPVYM